VSDDYCYATAEFIINFFCKNNAKIIENSTHSISEILDNKHSESEKFKELLFKCSLKNQHLIIHMPSDPQIHSFVIEKECNEDEYFYRIYQSWYMFYNLSTWLSIPNSYEIKYKTNFTQEEIDYIDTYGKGKKLTLEELKSFLIETAELIPNLRFNGVIYQLNN
jgi:hypothetical protein